jgi:hypothetical protein
MLDPRLAKADALRKLSQKDVVLPSNIMNTDFSLVFNPATGLISHFLEVSTIALSRERGVHVVNCTAMIETNPGG